MQPDGKQEEYLQKANHADSQARKAGDQSAAAAWRQIASGYRDLAMMREPARPRSARIC